jgi:glycosyltransferase involved in cell wall biosynthesis
MTGMQPERPDVALVIPVWNDAAGLERLLCRARSLGCFRQIIVIDDGSDTAVPAAKDITLIRHERSRGGGAARNTGLWQVDTGYLVYCDSDDLPTAEMPQLLADLTQAGSFDFCLFKHADSQRLAQGLWGPPDWDETLWEQAGCGCGALSAAVPATLPILAQTANYPWNKVYRTEFLRQNRILCAETQVHQDIPLHWRAFLTARDVLVSDRICLWHEVDPNGGRLSNRRGRDRFDLLVALDQIGAAALAKGGGWPEAFGTFALGVIAWAKRQIDPTLAAEFDRASADWLQRQFGPVLDRLALDAPDLARRLAQDMSRQ